MLFTLIFTLLSCDFKKPDSASSDREALLNAHERILEAHRKRDIDLMMGSVGAETLIVANRGDISWLTRAEQETRWRTYFTEVTFSAYRDLQPPIVTISDDGSLGWVIAQVEIIGERKIADGAIKPINDVWAWIELYEKRSGSWVAVGNVSNVRAAKNG